MKNGLNSRSSSSASMMLKSLSTVMMMHACNGGRSLATENRRAPLPVEVAGRLLTTMLPAKAVRKAKAAIAEHGAGGVACVV